MGLSGFFRKNLKRIKEMCPLCGHDWLVFAGTVCVASVLCALLRTISASDVYVPMIFVLAVLVISLLTSGYFYGILAAILSVFGVNWAFTYPYFHLDFSITGYPITFLTMLAVGLVCSTLTARLKEQEKIRVKSAQESIRANLLRAVSHDLRTPLTSISGSISAVLDSGGDANNPQNRVLLHNAKEDADWLYRVVENLLSITRVSNGKVSGLNRREELLEEILSEAVTRFRRNAGSEPAVSVSVPEEPLFLPMDAMLIEQVIINLLDNAVSHGKTTTRIDVTAKEAPGFVTVCIKDNGVGIDRRIVDHLFDGSLQLSGGDTAKHNSMGIGLMVCRTIVEAHGGEISARNGPEGGAEFTFTLPTEGNDDNQG